MNFGEDCAQHASAARKRVVPAIVDDLLQAHPWRYRWRRIRRLTRNMP